MIINQIIHDLKYFLIRAQKSIDKIRMKKTKTIHIEYIGF